MKVIAFLIAFVVINLRNVKAASEIPLGKTNCTADISRTLVYCGIPEWNPSLLENEQLNLSQVQSLHVDIKVVTGKLSKAHLNGLINLRSIIVRGFCHPNPKMRWCKVPSGLSEIDDDAFDATPELTGVSLILHSLQSVSFLTRLRKLRFLKLRWMRSLTEIDALAFSGMRNTLENLLLWYVPLKELSAKTFKGMPKLRVLEIVTINELTIRSQAISDLPKLNSLLIAFSTVKPTKLIFDKNALSNLPNLREAVLRRAKEIYTINGPACTELPNITSLVIASCNVSLFDHCPQLLRCDMCGQNPKLHPQTVEIRQPGGSQIPLQVLPSPKITPMFNISRLYIYHSNYPYSFIMFRQLPLLKVFISEHLYTHKYYQRGRRITRFTENPFAQLPEGTRLEKVRITVRRCDCQLLQIIDWMKTNQINSDKRNIHDIFKIDCLGVDKVCSDDGEGTDERLFVHWMNLTLLTEKLTSVCYPTNNSDVDSYPSYIPRSQCSCTKFETCASNNSKTKVSEVPLLAYILMYIFLILS